MCPPPSRRRRPSPPARRSSSGRRNPVSGRFRAMPRRKPHRYGHLLRLRPADDATPCTSIWNPLGGPCCSDIGAERLGHSVLAHLHTHQRRVPGASPGTTREGRKLQPEFGRSLTPVAGGGFNECFDVTVGPSSTNTTPAATTITLGQTDAALGTVTGNTVGGNPTGTVTFYECGPTATASRCTSTTDQLGGPVSLTAGSGRHRNSQVRHPSPRRPPAHGAWPCTTRGIATTARARTILAAPDIGGWAR